MKNLFFSLLAIAVTALVISLTPSIQLKQNDKTWPGKVNKQSIVVMELFTSQGCSSCPPADHILGKYAMKNETWIIPLAFHVDYWNRLGWVDSFSSDKYTQRQHDYADKLGLSSVYTPQLIINGQKELVGSEEARIGLIVSDFSTQKATTGVNISSTDINGSILTIGYTVNDLLPRNIINAALVQNEVKTRINAGENRGLILTNYNVVRDFVTSNLSGVAGQISLKIPKGNSSNGFSVVLYLQDEISGKIFAASKRAL